MKKTILKSLGLVGILVASSSSFGQGLVNMSSGLQGQAGAAVDIISMGAYVFGVALGMKGILKIKESSDTKGQVPISQGLIILAVSGALLALPTILSMNKGVVGGNGTSGTSIGGGGLRQIN